MDDKRKTRTRITIESEGKKIEIATNQIEDLSEMVELLEEALYAIGFRFKGHLDFIEDEENE